MPLRSRFPHHLRITGSSQEAFTLLELMVVLVLVSIMMALSVPRFQNTVISDPLKRSARQIIGMVKEARQRATDSPKGCGLVIKIDEGDFALFCPQPRFDARGDSDAIDDFGEDIAAEDTEDETLEAAHLLTIPESSRIKSVWNGDSTRFTIGEVTLWINSDGLMEPSVINLSDGSDELGLVISPFISDIRIDDEAVVPDDYIGSEALL